MDSSGPHSRTLSLGALWAVAEADLKSLFRSRITYAWVLGALFIQVIRVLSARGTETVSAVVSSGLGDFVYFWALVIIGLSASSVSSESGELADSIMSKSITRIDYVLAKFASRLTYTLSTYALVTLVLVSLSLKLETVDYTWLGLVSAVLLVALALSMLTAVGVGLSIALSNTVIAIIALLVLWYSMSLFFPLIGLGVLSPSFMLGRLPDIITGSWGWTDAEIVASLLGVSVASVLLSSAYFDLKDI